MTENRYSDNRELARDFRELLYCVKPVTPRETLTWEAAIRAVENHSGNIPEAFYKGTSIKSMKIPGIGRANAASLQALLNEGIQVATDQRQSGRSVASSVDWENAKRIIEDVDGKPPKVREYDLRFFI